MRVLVVDGDGHAPAHVVPSAQLPELFEPGDLLVVNDAATLPASIMARTEAREPVEIRLASARGDATAPRFTAALLGRGDYRTRTEERPAPPPVRVGDRLTTREPGLVAVVVRISPYSSRLVDLDFHLDDANASLAATWAALYRAGRPVQYAHVPAPLALWDVQNVWAGRPWAVEMPSAGRILRNETVLALRRRGVGLSRITHAAGLSATGDAAIDSRLPLPERFEVPEETARAVALTKARGGRVVAVGTSVARALESAAQVAGRGAFRAATGITDLRLGPDSPRRVVDGILTGVHEAETTHFALLRAFADIEVLERAHVAAEEAALLGHELGDAWLVWGDGRAASATVAA